MGGLPASTVNGFAIQPANPKVMLAAMRDGVFRSEDAGETWTRAEGPKNVAAVTMNPKRPAEAYAVSVDGTVFISGDGGRTWRPRR